MKITIKTTENRIKKSGLSVDSLDFIKLPSGRQISRQDIEEGNNLTNINEESVDIYFDDELIIEDEGELALYLKSL